MKRLFLMLLIIAIAFSILLPAFADRIPEEKGPRYIGAMQVVRCKEYVTLRAEPYIQEPALGNADIAFPYQVPDSSWFVMGDHRATSIDSRNTAVGCVYEEQIVGKVVFRIWPLRSAGGITTEQEDE